MPAHHIVREQSPAKHRRCQDLAIKRILSDMILLLQAGSEITALIVEHAPVTRNDPLDVLVGHWESQLLGGEQCPTMEPLVGGRGIIVIIRKLIVVSLHDRLVRDDPWRNKQPVAFLSPEKR